MMPNTWHYFGKPVGIDTDDWFFCKMCPIAVEKS
jgi:hypothetical protein